MWRYREAIPLDSNSPIVSFAEGFTPLLPVEIAGRQVLIKQEQLFPSGSYKDRGASVMISQIKQLGITKVVEDSSGNAGAAVAAYCAAAGIQCDIYVPESTSPSKLAQITRYGATLHKIPGSREDTAQAVMTAAEDTYYASHSWNPFFFHGTKTFAFEVCEQLGWQAPDTVILPVGNGTLLLGAYIGFSELVKSGIINRVPRFIGVQAQRCAPLFHAFTTHSDTVACAATGEKTMAEGIAIAAPIRGQQILAAVKHTGGEFITVNEMEILASLTAMFQKGHYIEPTSAAAIAGIKKYVEVQREMGTIDAHEVIVSAFTGHGLKST